MNASRAPLTVTLTLLVLVVLLAGCTTAKSTVRQKDGTYRTTQHLIFKPSMSDFLEFRCIVFPGRNLNCKVVGRTLTINGRSFGEFKEGDRIHIMPDGKVLVNDAERLPLEAG